MTRRLEAGPLLVTVGAVLLLVSLFLHWFTGEITAWAAFEVWDLVLFVLALGAIAAGLGLSVDAETIDRRWLPAAVAAVAIVVASQIIDPPPAAEGEDADTGAWLALGSALVMCIGSVLTFGRVHLALTVEGRDPRQHVSAVDARGPQDPTTDSHEPVSETAGGRLFGRDRTADEREEAAAEPAPDPVAAPTSGTEPVDPEAGDRAPEEKQD
jgi:hypothetical protein